MKRTMFLILAVIMTMCLWIPASYAESGKRVAKDGAQIQTDDPAMPTRLPPENGTKFCCTSVIRSSPACLMIARRHRRWLPNCLIPST